VILKDAVVLEPDYIKRIQKIESQHEARKGHGRWVRRHPLHGLKLFPYA
jgi:hypothetical protein